MPGSSRIGPAFMIPLLWTTAVGCALAPSEAWRVAPPASPRTVTEAIDCAVILDMTPEEAERHLRERGYAIAWRHEETTDDGLVAEPATDPPDGVITDVVVDGSEVFVFVMSPDDPAFGDHPIGAGCLER